MNGLVPIRKKRSCGDCIVCCTYLKIESPQMNKKGMEHCAHVNLPDPAEEGVRYYSGASCEGNCKIYDSPDKPTCCSGYECLWKQGHGEEEDRPDKSLILFDRTKQVQNAIEVKPLEEGREDTEEGIAVIERMSKSYGSPAIVLNFYERKVKRIVGRPN